MRFMGSVTKAAASRQFIFVRFLAKLTAPVSRGAHMPIFTLQFLKVPSHQFRMGWKCYLWIGLDFQRQGYWFIIFEIYILILTAVYNSYPLDAKHTLHSDYKLPSFCQGNNLSSECTERSLFFSYWLAQFNEHRKIRLLVCFPAHRTRRVASIRTLNLYGKVFNTFANCRRRKEYVLHLSGQELWTAVKSSNLNSKN